MWSHCDIRVSQGALPSSDVHGFSSGAAGRLWCAGSAPEGAAARDAATSDGGGGGGDESVLK